MEIKSEEIQTIPAFFYVQRGTYAGTVAILLWDNYSNKALGLPGYHTYTFISKEYPIHGQGIILLTAEEVLWMAGLVPEDHPRTEPFFTDTGDWVVDVR